MTFYQQKLPPLTEQEMRELWRRGDPLSEIAQKAKHRNGLSKREVRIIIFGTDK